MIAIYDETTGTLEQIVHSLDGVDLTGKQSIPAPDGWEDKLEWNSSARKFVTSNLSRDKKRALSEIDRIAEDHYRRRFRSGVIETMVETEKLKEAKAFIANPDAPASQFPLLQNEVGLTANTLAEVATLVADKPHQEKTELLAASLAIEPARLRARQAVRKAKSRSEIVRIVRRLSLPNID